MTNSATKWTIDRTSQDSTLETYGDKSGFNQSLILKTIRADQVFQSQRANYFLSFLCDTLKLTIKIC